jgi:hypothetical protein
MWIWVYWSCRGLCRALEGIVHLRGGFSSSTQPMPSSSPVDDQKGLRRQEWELFALLCVGGLILSRDWVKHIEGASQLAQLSMYQQA